MQTHVGDCRDIMRALSGLGYKARTCVTSPPYFGLRDYGHEGQLGLEQTPEEYVANMVEVFRCVRDMLTDDGTLWLNIGDSYNSGASGGLGGSTLGGGQANQAKSNRSVGRKATGRLEGLKHKDLIGIPWMLAFALRADGWYLRQDIIWNKPNPMPESVTDRCTKAHEYVFLLSKSERYYFDHEAIKEPAVSSPRGNSHSFARVTQTTPPPGKPVQHRVDRAEVAYHDTRNRRSVWSVATRPYKGAHFATFPPDLIEPCILAGSEPGDIVLDPFGGSGTTAGVALAHGRDAILCELNPEYAALVPERVASIAAKLRMR